MACRDYSWTALIGIFVDFILRIFLTIDFYLLLDPEMGPHRYERSSCSCNLVVIRLSKIP